MDQRTPAEPAQSIIGVRGAHPMHEPQAYYGIGPWRQMRQYNRDADALDALRPAGSR